MIRIKPRTSKAEAFIMSALVAAIIICTWAAHLTRFQRQPWLILAATPLLAVLVVRKYFHVVKSGESE